MNVTKKNCYTLQLSATPRKSSNPILITPVCSVSLTRKASVKKMQFSF